MTGIVYRLVAWNAVSDGLAARHSNDRASGALEVNRQPEGALITPNREVTASCYAEIPAERTGTAQLGICAYFCCEQVLASTSFQALSLRTV